MPTDPRFIVLTGRAFGRYQVVGYAGKSGKNHQWHCRCDCGTDKVVQGVNLTGGRVVSCGCYHSEELAGRQRLHGHKTRGKVSPEYRAWCLMRERCSNPKGPHYHRYGGRGITVCERWGSFENFLADMGERPSPKHSLDRVDFDGNYEPGNCRWATVEEQANNTSRNRFIEFNGERLTLAQAARKYGLKARQISDRLRAGWLMQDALLRPTKSNGGLAWRPTN